MINFDDELEMLKYDMKSMYERWLRTEAKFDSILKAQQNNKFKTDIIIALELLIVIILWSMQ